ncbi:hypothetical protein GCK32_009170 [Trichostrongylus colubriformis]|uniref:Peptidase aspartic putative domain-containing protein n=1 Tax=Trichostrongylus colubriformis TaxID=6319 RepID=A0AAN8FVT8_TRICO
MQTTTTPDSTSANLCNFVDASLLSKVDLPSFSGSILEFQEFWERFSTLVGNKPHINDATKFSLLKSSLKGRALHSIQGLPITSANYYIAVDILKTHFDDRVTTRHVLFTKLANLPPCDQSGKELQALYNQMYALIRQFCTYEDDSKEYGLGAILLNKLPRHVRSRIYDRTNNETNLTPTALIQLLTEIVRKDYTLREMELSEDDSSTRYMYHTIRGHSSTTRLKNNAPSSQRNKCSLCSRTSHNTFDCQTYKTAAERIEIVKRNRLCFNCLSKNHHTKHCPSKRLCLRCSKKHHTSLCFKTSSKPLPSTPFARATGQMTYRRDLYQNQASQPHRRSQQQLQQSPREQHTHIHLSDHVPAKVDTSTETGISSTLHVTSFSSDPSKPSLMCTEVVLFNPSDESKEERVTALLDTGASQSYITTDLTRRLQLRTSNSQQITMYTFGKEDPISMDITNHELGIHCNDNTSVLLKVQPFNPLAKIFVSLREMTIASQSVY